MVFIVPTSNTEEKTAELKNTQHFYLLKEQTSLSLVGKSIPKYLVNALQKYL
jgi:hypothetical protein